jgi:hypothetical protein
MKGHLLHNIHNNDNKIESKIKNQEIHFITNLGQKKNFKPCILPFYFILLSNVDVLLSFPFPNIFICELNLTLL